MQDTVNDHELVSALADGQLRGQEFAHTLERLDADNDARLTWHAYHVVGDVLRSGEIMAGRRDADFMQRLQRALLQEAPLVPMVNAADSIAVNAIRSGVRNLDGSADAAANEARFRWKLVAGLASLAAVSVIGWQASSGWGDQRAAPTLAQQAVQPDSVSLLPLTRGGAEPRVMIRDPQLDALLAAHKQFGGTSALQMPAGFLRNATFDGVER